ncbi:MAG: tRNA pseudouridine(55) synthase TruB [bacterium]|nr:tRNA pseudouridine(55) synthase TruB [bacterium]
MMLLHDYIIAVKKEPNEYCQKIVDYFRIHLNIKKIGFAGTLDPIAEGLMIFGIGRNATKRLSKWTNCDKLYRAKIHFGYSSDTDDITGKLERKGKSPIFDEIQNVLNSFIGTQLQKPPIFSAIQVNGQRAYRAARSGVPFDLKERTIEIYSLKIEKFQQDELTLTIHCSKGTYIRAFARDIGHKLNTCAVMSGLQRLKIGDVDLSQAESPKKIVECFLKQSYDEKFVVEVFPNSEIEC